MKYEKIENLEKPLSKIIYGTSSKPFLKGEDCNQLLDGLVKMGITTFDTARVYGKSERVLGNWMQARGNREELTILSKGGHPALFIPRLSERSIRKDINLSLQELKTDYIDIYLLHRDDPRRPAGYYVEVLNALHAEGKIRVFGGSNWKHTRIQEANEYAYSKNLIPFTVSSPYFGLGDMKGDPFGNGAVSIAGAKNVKAREWYKQNGMAVCAYAVLGNGLFRECTNSASDLKGWAKRAFSGKENFERLRRAKELAKKRNCSVTQIALAWFMQQEMNVFAVISSLNVNRMCENVAALDINLTGEELSWLDLKN